MAFPVCQNGRGQLEWAFLFIVPCPTILFTVTLVILVLHSYKQKAQSHEIILLLQINSLLSLHYCGKEKKFLFMSQTMYIIAPVSM